MVNQVHLGPLEATTLAGGDLAGLKKWLADYGYSIRPTVSDALNPYVRDGWSFVAMRLTSAVPIVGGLDPVKMTFRSSQLLYPMRLAVSATSPRQVIVFTLSDHRQQRTDADASKQATETRYAGKIANAVSDPLLRELTGNHGSYLTKIQVDISKPAQISSDFTFANAPNDDAYRQVVFADHNVAIPLELILLGGLACVAITATVTIWAVLKQRRRA